MQSIVAATVMRMEIVTFSDASSARISRSAIGITTTQPSATNRPGGVEYAAWGQ